MTDTYEDRFDETVAYCWIDMETTGLQPPIGRSYELPLEVGAILTNAALEELGDYSSLILPAHWRDTLAGSDQFVQDMHLKSELTAELELAEKERRPYFLEDVDRGLRTWLDQFGGPPKAIPMAGSTINFDRHFMGFLPISLDWFHYRNIDVSSVKELCKKFNPGLYAQLPPLDDKKHRVLDDLRASIAELKWYRDNFMVTTGHQVFRNVPIASPAPADFRIGGPGFSSPGSIGSGSLGSC